jgi:cytochrome c
MNRLSLASLLLIAGCDGGSAMGAQGSSTVDAAVDDGLPDARSLGMLDGGCTGHPGRPRVLVYTYENLWRHLSNLHARAAIGDMCASRGFTVETTNDPHSINATRLANIDVVVFSITSGSGIDRFGKQDFENWVRAGGGVVGLEAASATEPAWPFYVDTLGASFKAHPPTLEPGTVRFTGGHPITEGLPPTLTLTEQWYTFTSRPENVPGLEVLMTLDESTLPDDFPPEHKIGYHAIGWVHEPFGGRVFYTGIGDNPVVFEDPVVLELLGRAIEWAAHRR